MPASLIDQIYNFDIPGLGDNLIKTGLASTPAEGELLFRELKRWLILSHADISHKWEIYSRKIDRTWNLFTRYESEYARFCQEFFGGLISYDPENTFIPGKIEERKYATFEEFRICYEQLFSTPLPDLWFEEEEVPSLEDGGR